MSLPTAPGVPRHGLCTELHAAGKGGRTPVHSTGRRVRPILLTLCGLLVALSVVASVGWRLAGGSLFTIATPSMCPGLSVGTLVLDQPVSGLVQVGEVLTFRPPGTSVVYTHRVVQVLPGGDFKTAGDALRTVDPWTVPPERIVGRVVANVAGLGWLWRALPEMAAALACYLFARRAVRDHLRRQLDLLFVTLLVVIPVITLRPLLRAALIAGHPGRRGAFVMQVANVGLLPAQFQVRGAAPVLHVAPGQIVTLTARTRGTSGVVLRELVSFSAGQWVMTALIVLLPMLGLLANALVAQVRTGRRPREPGSRRPTVTAVAVWSARRAALGKPKASAARYGGAP